MNVRTSLLTFMGPSELTLEAHDLDRAAWSIGLSRQGTGVMALPVANQDRMLSIMH